MSTCAVATCVTDSLDSSATLAVARCFSRSRANAGVVAVLAGRVAGGTDAAMGFEHSV